MTLVVCHTSELMYVEYPRSDRIARAHDYSDIITGAPEFPDKLALIAMPYSQESSLFSNLLICHEIGHFVYEELEIEQKLMRTITDGLRKKFASALHVLDYRWCRDRLLSWAEEVFCDRFAIGLVGPAFSFAYIEFFDLIGVADDEKINQFNESHPADSFRLHEHASQLRRNGWSEFLAKRGKTYAAFIEKLASIHRNRYSFVSDQRSHLARRVLDVFLDDVNPKIDELVKKTFDGTETRFSGGQPLFDCVDAVHDYLKVGVVPATIVKDKKAYRPDPILLINAAYLFQLEDIPALMANIDIDAGAVNNLHQRQKWSQRVESWTIKALEDLRFRSVERRPWRK